MRHDKTPWNRSYKHAPVDIAKELRSKRRGRAVSEAQREHINARARNFVISHQPSPVAKKLHPDDKSFAKTRKDALDAFEDRMLRDAQKEVWE